jgi:hypothetical protein
VSAAAVREEWLLEITPSSERPLYRRRGATIAFGPDTRGQLLFTTHDLLLMDQDLLRRDEMWVTERDRRGVPRMLPTAAMPAIED